MLDTETTTIEEEATVTEGAESTETTTTTTSAEPKQEGEGAGEKKDDDPAEPKAEIEYKLELPKDSGLDKGTVDEIASFAKEQGLSNDQAQKVLDRESSAIKTFQEGQQAEFDGKVTEWETSVKNDKELGGDNFKESVALSQRTLEKFGSKELVKTLNETGLGSHPELIRVFNRIGKAMGDDNFVNPGSDGPKEKTAEEIMYGKGDAK